MNQRAELKQWGNSHAIRLSKSILEEVSFALNDSLIISTDGEKLVISKEKKELKAGGILSKYANPSLIELEKDAYRKGVLEKYHEND